MVSATTAEATKYGVTIKHPDGYTLKVERASLADDSFPHGINTDEADDLAERLGYSTGRWRWHDGYYKTVVLPLSHGRHQADRAKGSENERSVRLQIARTGKRPSGKPLTPEMRRWVEEYKQGKRDF